MPLICEANLNWACSSTKIRRHNGQEERSIDKKIDNFNTTAGLYPLAKQDGL